MEYSEGTGVAMARLFWESAVQNRPDARAREIVPNGAMGPPLKAHSPEPANGARDTSRSLVLAWTAGDMATRHHVYLGTEAETVTNADTTTAGVYRGRQNGTTFDPGALDWGRAYYWRIDEEEADGAVRKGSLWAFSTAAFLIVDDFESYTDDSPDRIFQTWIDGFGYTDPTPVAGNNTGSTVGNNAAPFAERNLVHGGRQSMPMQYDNSVSPFYSEVERTWSGPQDWTTGSFDTLVVYFRGHASNEAGPMYVAIQDSAGRVGVAAHPDPKAVASITWVEWKVPLSDFTSAGVNVAAVKKMYLGVGNRNSPAAGGKGKIYIDDIRVVKPAQP
jgi:hypothetical protein